MIFVFTGNGKGKTTSAIGQGIRVIGQGKKVLMIQFIKSEKWPTGEEKIIKELSPRFKIIKGGKGFVGIMGDKLPFKAHKNAAQKSLQLAKKEILSRKFDLIILDEILVALSLKLISLKSVVDVLKISKKLKEIDIVLTGRGANQKIMKMADLVTECKEIKHNYQKGVVGKRSREY